MSASPVQRFIDALQQLEERGDVEPMVGLYSDDAVVSNIVLNHEMHGREGARRFWTNYRGNFKDVKSTFRNIVTAGSRAALEWQTEGSSRDGSAVTYSGTSILELDGDQITRFAAYFDPRQVGRSIEETLHPPAAGL